MTTYTAQTAISRRRSGTTAWTSQHPVISTLAALAAAVLAGVLIGILFSGVLSGTQAVPQHRAGGHAGGGHGPRDAARVGGRRERRRRLPSAHSKSLRSPARGGFAVGRTAGAGSGVIAIGVGTHAPARGFPGRSLGAGARRPRPS